jgi:hypothetical protein
MSTPAANTTAANTIVAPPASAATQIDLLPQATTLLHAAKLAIKHDKPIQLDYYVDTALGKAFLGEDTDRKERVLVKSKDEFTSTIAHTYKVGDDFLIMTENSIYIVNGKMQKKRISMASLTGDDI